jgi:cytochrome c-type biogenesis protein CcmH
MSQLTKSIFIFLQTEKRGRQGEGEIPPSKFQVAKSASTIPPRTSGFCNLKASTPQRTTLRIWKVEGRKVFLLIFLCLCAFVVNIFVLAQDAPPATLDAKVFEIAGELRCPVCTAESVGDSSAPIAVEMRNVIQEQLEQGKSEKEILAFFQERYGDWILLNPPKRGVHLLVWLLPLVAALIGVGFLVMYLKRWTKQAKAPIEASAEDLERVREEMRWQE